MNLKPRYAWRRNVLAHTKIDNTGGMEGAMALIDVLINTIIKFFSRVCDFLLFDYQKQQHFPSGNCLYRPLVTTVSYSLIFIGRLYAKCKSNLLPCHDNSPLTPESWRGTPNKTE